MRWIVAYDVSDNKKRARLAKYLESEGVRLQKSIFLVEVRQHHIEIIRSRIIKLIGKEEEVLLIPLLGGADKRINKLGTEIQPFVIASMDNMDR